MDPVTHTLAGLCITNAIAKDRIERSALLGLVLVSANIADLDLFLSAFWGTTWFYTHWPGVLHTVWALLIVPLGIAAVVHWRRPNIGFRSLWLVILGCYAAHLVLDALTAFGIAPLAPFSQWRWSIGWVSVVDVGIWVILAAPLWMSCSNGATRRRLNARALLGVAVYILVCGTAHWLAVDQVGEQSEERGTEAVSSQAYPAGLLPLFWDGVVSDGSSNHHSRLNLVWADDTGSTVTTPVNSTHTAVTAVERSDVGAAFRAAWSLSPYARIYCTEMHKRTVLMGDIRFQNALMPGQGIALVVELTRDKQSLVYTMDSYRWLGPTESFTEPETRCGFLRKSSVP